MTTDVLAKPVAQSPASGPPVAGFVLPSTIHRLECIARKRTDRSGFGRGTTWADSRNPGIPAVMHLQTDMTTEETPVATIVKNAQQQAATAATKEQRARDAALAMREYEAEQLAVRANTARLRALRLAKEAGDRQHAKTKKSAKQVRRSS